MKIVKYSCLSCLFVFVSYSLFLDGCSSGDSVGKVRYQICLKDPIKASPKASPTNSSLFSNQKYQIGFGRYRTNLSGGRHFNMRTLRASLLKLSDGTVREIAPSLIDSIDSYTWVTN